MKEKRILKCPKKLIHLSEENHNGEWFKPRVPDSIYQSFGFNSKDNEDDITRRVCFSGSITGAFYAINFDGKREKLYVHIPENIDDVVKRGKLYKPTIEQVFDVNYTDEYWVKCKVKMKCIGYISIGYTPSVIENRPKVRFKYLKKFNEKNISIL